jgi:hypothetical protein
MPLCLCQLHHGCGDVLCVAAHSIVEVISGVDKGAVFTRIVNLIGSPPIHFPSSVSLMSHDLELVSRKRTVV